MVEIKGIYAASVSVLNDDMSLNIKKTANHCDNIIKDGCNREQTVSVRPKPRKPVPSAAASLLSLCTISTEIHSIFVI